MPPVQDGDLAVAVADQSCLLKVAGSDADAGAADDAADGAVVPPLLLLHAVISIAAAPISSLSR
jgi:hypothetical protein